MDNRVTQITSGSVVSAYEYDSFSRMTKVTNKNNSTAVVTSDIGYLNPDDTSTTSLVHTWKNTYSNTNKTFTYNYDTRGNITSISDGTYTTTYTYDQYDQLTRENNQAAGKTWVYTYDNAGNILSKKEYTYTTGTLGTPTDTITYEYEDETWHELLTEYDGNTISYDGIGNMLSDGTWTYTWEHGRHLATATDGTTSVSYEYNIDGIRQSKTVGSTKTKYYYIGSQLVEMTQGTDKLHFTYDAAGASAVTYNDTTYYYLRNAQGDILGIVNTSGTVVVSYTYDAWGNLLSVTGSMANTLGALNPLRYRGYVYDNETGLYYLQSRYYDPSMGRFICADGFTTTGQGNLGANMYAYCGNNPVNLVDPLGTNSKPWYEYILEFLGVLFSPFDAFIQALEVEAGVGYGLGGSVEYKKVEVSAEWSINTSIQSNGDGINFGDRYNSGFSVTYDDIVGLDYMDSYFHTDYLCGHNLYNSSEETVKSCPNCVHEPEKGPVLYNWSISNDNELIYNFGASFYFIIGGYWSIEWNQTTFNEVCLWW